MEEQVIKNGWKKLTSDTTNDYLYKSVAVTNLTAGRALIVHVVDLINECKLDKSCHLSLDGFAVTISLNSPAERPLNTAYLKLALEIDG